MKRTIELVAATILLLAAAVGCARDPHGLVITKQSRASVVRRVERSKKLTPEEKRLFASFIEHENQKLRPSSEGKSVTQIIDEERESEAGLAKAAAAMEELVQVLQKAADSVNRSELRKLSFQVLALRSDGRSAPLSGVDVDYVVENGFEKDVAGFEGSLRLSDEQGNRVVELAIAEAEPLRSGESLNRTRHLSALFHPGLAEKLTAIGTVKCNWFPTKVTFTDGAQLVATPRVTP